MKKPRTDRPFKPVFRVIGNIIGPVIKEIWDDDDDYDLPETPVLSEPESPAEAARRRKEIYIGPAIEKIWDDDLPETPVLSEPESPAEAARRRKEIYDDLRGTFTKCGQRLF